MGSVQRLICSKQESFFLGVILVNRIASLPLDLTTYDQDLFALMRVLSHVWTNDQYILNSLSRLFVLSCSIPSSEDFLFRSPALEAVLQNAPLTVLPQAVQFLTNSTISNDSLERALIQILQWPLTLTTGLCW